MRIKETAALSGMDGAAFRFCLYKSLFFGYDKKKARERKCRIIMTPIQLITGNLCSLIAMFTDSISNTRKTTRAVLLFQSISQGLYGIGSVVLGGYSGAVQNAVSILRNFVAIRKINSKVLQWALAILGVALGVCFNNLGLVGWLPIVANLEYTLAVFYFKDNQRALKIAFLVTVALFGIFNGFIYNVVGVVTNSVVLITGIVALARKENQEDSYGKP